MQAITEVEEGERIGDSDAEKSLTTIDEQNQDSCTPNLRKQGPAYSTKDEDEMLLSEEKEKTSEQFIDAQLLISDFLKLKPPK